MANRHSPPPSPSKKGIWLGRIYLAYPAAEGDAVYPVLSNESRTVDSGLAEKEQDKQDPLREQDRQDKCNFCCTAIKKTNNVYIAI